MKLLYEHLEERGRRIFRATYNGKKEEETFQEQEIAEHLLEVFYTGSISILRKEWEISDIETLFLEVRKAIFQGIFLEAIELSREKKGVIQDPSEVRNVVNISRKKIISLIGTFNVKKFDEKPFHMHVFPRKFSAEVAVSKKQVEEVTSQYKESQEARRKSEFRLIEALGKFREDRHNLLRKQSLLETEKEWLVLEKNQLGKELKKTIKESNGVTAENGKLKEVIQEKESTLRRVSARMQAMEIELGQEKKSKEVLMKIDKEFQALAKEGDTGPERFHSILSELGQLREKQGKFEHQEDLYGQLVSRTYELTTISEALMRDLKAQERLTKQVTLDSLLDENFNTDEHMLETYYTALEEYFAISLYEYPKQFKDHTALEDSATKLRELFFLVQSRLKNPLKLWEERLKEKKEEWRARHDLKQYNVSPFAIVGIYSEIIRFLESLAQNKKAIRTYEKIADTKV